MNLERKGSPITRKGVVGDFPSEFPRLPEEIIERFPSASEYQQAIDEWYYALQTVLNRQAARVDALEKELANTS